MEILGLVDEPLPGLEALAPDWVAEGRGHWVEEPDEEELLGAIGGGYLAGHLEVVVSGGRVVNDHLLDVVDGIHARGGVVLWVLRV